ncbi:MAG: hypothetical protein QXW47_07220 [Candidatus Jordarchaeales archaeon]
MRTFLETLKLNIESIPNYLRYSKWINFLKERRLEMSDPTILHGLLLALTIVLAVIAVEVKRLDYAVISFAGMCIVLGVLFYLLFAPWVAVLQLVIFAGAIAVLLLVTINVAREPVEREEDE